MLGTKFDLEKQNCHGNDKHQSRNNDKCQNQSNDKPKLVANQDTNKSVSIFQDQNKKQFGIGVKVKTNLKMKNISDLLLTTYSLSNRNQKDKQNNHSISFKNDLRSSTHRFSQRGLTQSYLEDKKENTLFPKIETEKNLMINKTKTSFNLKNEIVEKKFLRFANKRDESKILFLKGRLDHYNVKYHQETAQAEKQSECFQKQNEVIEEYETSLCGMINKIQNKRNNQDQCLMFENGSQHIYLICDGHGAQGHLISQFIKKTLKEELSQPICEDQLEEQVIRIIETLDKKLKKTSYEIYLSGSTLNLTILNKESQKLYNFNVGDSRAILINRSKNYIQQLSVDHKPELPDEQTRIISQGGRIFQLKNQNNKKVGPYRVWQSNKDIPGLAMSRSIGDLAAKQVGVIFEPTVSSVQLWKGQKYLLAAASDGIWEVMNNSTFKDKFNMMAKQSICLQIILGNIVQMARNIWLTRDGVSDDITLILAQFQF